MLAKLNPACVVCGSKNEKGLRIRFERGADDVSAKWVPGKEWQSFQRTIHGGIVTAVLDEAMSQAIIENDWEALTAELKVRFRSRVTLGEALEVRGWITRRKAQDSNRSGPQHEGRRGTRACMGNVPGAVRAAGTCGQKVEL